MGSDSPENRRSARARLALALTLTGVGAGAPAPRPASAQLLPPPRAPIAHLEGTADELAGWEALDQGQFIKARELGDKVLLADPASFAGHFILGAALQHGEGDLARAAFHLEHARLAYERRWPRPLLGGLLPGGGSGPWRWHQATLRELSAALGALDRPEEQLRIIEQHNDQYSPPWQAQRIWPLMKLGRYEEAREAARQAMEGSGAAARKYARADLCGAESEAGDRRRAHDACVEATREFQDAASGAGQLELSNASDAALGVLRFDEAERFLVEAARRQNSVLWVNPYQQQAELFLTEGRIPEAIAALRAGQELRIGRPAWVDQFDRARFDAALAKVFLVVGIGDRAVAAATRAIEQPDRQGHASGSEVQADAASAVLQELALRDRAERAAEDATTAGFWASLPLSARAAWDRLTAWRAMRRAAVALADETFLSRSLRPYYLGILLPPWLLPELVDAVGGGVALAALDLARQAEGDATFDAYFDALRAEAELRRGQYARADALAAAALASLPQAEVLLRARLALVAAACARQRGDDSRAAVFLQAVLARDPGLLRRSGLALPVRIDDDGSELARAAARLVARSPRFDSGGGPLSVSLTGGAHPRACLVGPSREQLACASVNQPIDTGATAGARLLVAELHREAFAVHTDLSQSDLTSLDGSPTAGRADRHIQSVLDGLGR